MIHITTITSDITIKDWATVDTDLGLFCDTSNGAFTVTLPTTADLSGSEVVIKKVNIELNTLTIAAYQASETIDGETTVSITTGRGVKRLAAGDPVWLVLYEL